MAKRKSSRRMFIVLGVLVIAAAGGLALWQPWQVRPKAVAVETLKPGPISRVLAVNGNVAAARSVDIRSSVSGQVRTVGADVGDKVTKGETLISIDTSVPNAQVAQAQAALDAGKAQLAQAEATNQRMQALGDNASLSDRQTAELSLVAAQREVDRLQGLFDQARSQLAEYTISSPLDGTVIARSVDPGLVIGTATSLMTVADLSDLVVEADVDEIYSSEVRTGQKVALKPAGQSAALDGTLYFAAPTVDATTGGRAINMRFATAQELPVGLTVTANIIIDSKDSALSIPREALETDGADTRVKLIRNGVVAEQVVSVVDWPAERLIVRDGLKPGDQVILDPAVVKDGQAVVARP